jgi:signal transduction histidine kinase
MNDLEKTKDVILVVDDQPNNLKVIASLLSQEYTLSIANNGENALKMLEKGIPDLILLDIMMPDMDGFEVCRKIKENDKTKDIPIIFLTAKTDIHDIVKAFENGAVDYITKPFNQAEVKARVKTHIQLHHAKLKIEQNNKEKDKFFSIIAHDLRSPFSGIIGFSEILVEQIREKDYNGIEEFAELILQSANKSMELLTNLMTWALSQTGRLNYQPEPIYLNALVNETVSLISDTALNKSIKINQNIDSSIQLFVDKEMIMTILRNLIGNAIKFTHIGGSIHVVSEINSDKVTLSVIDSGIGMKPEMISDLFRLDKNTGRPGTNGEASTGLGLILCKEFAEKNGGTIWVESVEGKGSVFHLALPIKMEN